MHENESTKSASPFNDFPVGVWSISIQRAGEQQVSIGDLSFIRSSGTAEYYLGVMQFADDSQTLGNVAGLPFPVNITGFDATTGTVSFQILGATNIFDPNGNDPDQFAFEGSYNPLSPPFLTGTAWVPQSFGSQNGMRMKVSFEDGMLVTWTSGGPT